ncbi:hypothetical protein FD754_000691, partial [Muntiacus muntjak]
MWDTWVRSLGWENPLEKGKATHSNTLNLTCPHQTFDSPNLNLPLLKCSPSHFYVYYSKPQIPFLQVIIWHVLSLHLDLFFSGSYAWNLLDSRGMVLLFGSGVLASLSLSGPQLEKVVIDRSLVGKLISDTISDALLTDGFIILSFLAQNKLCFIQFAKKMSSPDTNRRLEKLSALDYKVLSSVRTEWDPLDVRFDTKHPNQVLTVECSISVDREPAADSCVYECVRNKIQCVSVTRIPLKSKAISCCRNATEDKLILGCEDSSVILYETHRRVTLLAQAELLPSLISCHPSGAILLVGSNQGELQIFDMALSPINIQLLAEDNSPRETLQFKKFFDVSSSLVQMQWIAPQVVSKKPESGDIYNLLFLRFDRGPLGVLLFKLGSFDNLTFLRGTRLGFKKYISIRKFYSLTGSLKEQNM